MTVSDEVYELCLPILKDEALEDEDKTEKMEVLLREKTSLKDKALENAILDAMWRHRGTKDAASSPAPARHTVIRKSSPAPWQMARTPTPSAASPRFERPPPGFGVAPPAFTRAKSSTAASPFTSPRPSPRLASASVHIPHSPSLNAYEFSNQPSPSTDEYGDYGSDTVDWLVNDDTASNASSFMADGNLNGSAAEFIPDQMDMYDMLRSILREDRSNEDLEKVLEANAYDLSATVTALMEASGPAALSTSIPTSADDRSYLVGKSMAPSFRPATPQNQLRTPVMCKYWLQTGHCARADCRFNHNPQTVVCKYWMNVQCIAGEKCVFSHDPSTLMSRMMLEGAQTPPSSLVQPAFQVQDYETFPQLQRTSSSSSQQLYQAAIESASFEKLYGAGLIATPPPGLNPFSNLNSRPSSRAHSRPGSRPASQQGHRLGMSSAPQFDDAEAFPSLGSAAKTGKKHHGKRGGHGHTQKENGPLPGSLADVVRMSPSPSPASARKGPRTNLRGSNNVSSRENSAAAMAIPQPEHIPWLETGTNANRAYLQARQEAFKHGAQRNKFLQSAAQAWNRNDTRAAKALSLRGQTENNLMKEAHREAARVLYEERNRDTSDVDKELYVDLHGLHPDEAILYLQEKLLAHQNNPSGRPIYAITGTGHHSKNGRDKVNKAVRAFLNEWRYAFREFSVPGDRNNIGGILGIDPGSSDRSQSKAQAMEDEAEQEASEADGKVSGQSTKVRILKHEDVEREAREAAERLAHDDP